LINLRRGKLTLSYMCCLIVFGQWA
jgi:hypothetical protein